MLSTYWFEDDKLADLKKALTDRFKDVSILDEIAGLSSQRKALIPELEELQASRNSVSKEIGKLKGMSKKDPSLEAEATAKMEKMRKVGDRISQMEERVAEIENKRMDLLLGIPNVPGESVPRGVSDEDNQEVRKWGELKKFDFKPKDHVELGETLGILNFERASKMSGARFSLLTGAGAALERALSQFMLDFHISKNGYEEVSPPLMVNRETMTGTGQLPKFEDDLFKTGVADRDLFLIPTAEVPLTNLYAGEILDGAQLPIKLTAHTPCFRSEAGSYGKDTRGLIRLHQFSKVELVKIAHPERSFEELESMTKSAEGILQALGLPYRVMLLCAGDMGFSATMTYDLEVWLPSQEKYREISSCSNCLDFQAQRARIRFKDGGKGKAQYVHTLNGSGLAVGRTFLAVLENYQDSKGRIQIPEALEPYIAGKPGFTRDGAQYFIQTPVR